MIDVPSTCVLYVNSAGIYRCRVENGSYYFEVTGKIIHKYVIIEFNANYRWVCIGYDEKGVKLDGTDY